MNTMLSCLGKHEYERGHNAYCTKCRKVKHTTMATTGIHTNATCEITNHENSALIMQY